MRQGVLEKVVAYIHKVLCSTAVVKLNTEDDLSRISSLDNISQCLHLCVTMSPRSCYRAILMKVTQVVIIIFYLFIPFFTSLKVATTCL